METFIIIDSLGAKHGSVKSSDKINALEKYIGTKVSEITATSLFCISEKDLKDFKNNIAKI